METQVLQGSRWRRAGRALAAAALVAGGTVVWTLGAQTPDVAQAAEPLKSLVPAPVSV